MTRHRRFEDMTLRWFGDEMPDFEEEEDDDDVEVVRLETNEVPKEEKSEDVEEDVPEQFKGLSKKQIVDKLMDINQKADSAQAVKEGIEGLAEQLKRPSTPNYGNLVQQQGESDEEFRKRLNQEIFSEDPASVLDEWWQRKNAGTQRMIGQNMVQMRKDFYRTNDETKETYKKYQQEIEDYIGSLDQSVRNNPQVVDYAYKEVKGRHQDEIINETVERKVKEMMEQNKEGKKSSGSFHTEGGSTTNTGVSRKKGKKIYITPEIEQAAKKKGVDPEIYARYVSKGGK